MADGADDPRLAELYRRLAATETRHASLWREQLTAAGAAVPSRPGWRARLLAMLARRFGPGLVASTVATQEATAQGMYDDQPEAAGTSLPADERSHARVLREVTRGVEGGVLARFEGRHKAVGGNALRAAVLGANDGLVSNFSLVMGVAGASGSGSAIIVAGFAGLLAGSLSMALGEWLSVQSARELYANQIRTEAAEIEEMPEEEEEELRLIYEAKGVPAENAREMAHRIMTGDRATALDTLAREELGIDPDELGGSAWVAAGTSFVLFGLGAIIPARSLPVPHRDLGHRPVGCSLGHRAVRDRRGNHGRDRTQRVALRAPPACLRVGCGGDHLRHRHAARYRRRLSRRTGLDGP